MARVTPTCERYEDSNNQAQLLLPGVVDRTELIYASTARVSLYLYNTCGSQRILLQGDPRKFYMPQSNFDLTEYYLHADL